MLALRFSDSFLIFTPSSFIQEFLVLVDEQYLTALEKLDGKIHEEDQEEEEEQYDPNTREPTREELNEEYDEIQVLSCTVLYGLYGFVRFCTSRFLQLLCGVECI